MALAHPPRFARVRERPMSIRLVRIGLLSMVTLACHRATLGSQPLLSQQEGIEAVSLCRDHLSLRNHGASTRTVMVDAGAGEARRVIARGRDTTTNLEYGATIVVLSSPGDSVRVTTDGQQQIRVPRSSAACVRDLPVANPDSILMDYTHASATALGPRKRGYAFSGAMLLTIASSASREDVNALIRMHSLALIGGRRGPTAASDVWAFWIEDGPDNARTEQMIDELKRSPLVRFAWPYLTLYGIS